MRSIKIETWEQVNSNYLINYGFMSLSLPNFLYLNKARLVKKQRCMHSCTCDGNISSSIDDF